MSTVTESVPKISHCSRDLRLRYQRFFIVPHLRNVRVLRPPRGILHEVSGASLGTVHIRPTRKTRYLVHLIDNHFPMNLINCESLISSNKRQLKFTRIRREDKGKLRRIHVNNTRFRKDVPFIYSIN